MVKMIKETHISNYTGPTSIQTTGDGSSSENENTANSVLSTSNATNTTEKVVRVKSRKRRDLKEDEMTQLAFELIDKETNLKLPHGYIKDVAEQFGISRWTVERVWKKVRITIQNNEKLNLKKQYKGSKGIELDMLKLLLMPLTKKNEAFDH